jgi:hypothetical protein
MSKLQKRSQNKTKREKLCASPSFQKSAELRWIYFTAAVSTGAWVAVVSAGAAAGTASAAFFFAHPLRLRTATDTHNIIATTAISFFTTFHLLVHRDTFVNEWTNNLKISIKYTKKLAFVKDNF